jgi:hypothetical protein
VTLPAYTILDWSVLAGGATEAASYLLLPDLGTTPVSAFRHAMVGLTDLAAGPQHLAAVSIRDEEPCPSHYPAGPQRNRWVAAWVLVIATPDERRAQLWRSLIDDVADRRGKAPVPARIATWETIVLPEHSRLRPGTGDGSAGREQDDVRPAAPPREWLTQTLPAICIGRRAPEAPPDRGDALLPGDAPLHLTDADRMLLDLTGRHPFLSPDDQATALGWAPVAVRRRRDALVASGLLRLLDPEETGEPRFEDEATGLAELTPAGMAVVAAQQGLTVGAAVRHNEVGGGGPTQPRGSRLSRARYGLLRHLRHTRGADGWLARLSVITTRGW